MEEPVDVIRECSRAALMVNRRVHRDEETDGRRRIVNEHITPAVIADLANRLKSKSAVSAMELRTLKNGILDDPHNIEVVLNNHGAVRGLVRELTGQDGRRQSEAAGCLCNLSGGAALSPGAALARAAGPYLRAALQSLNKDLAITCAWAIGNAAGSGPKATDLLTSQRAVPALARLMTSPHDDVSDAAAAALVQFAYQMGEEFREHESHILQAVTRKPFTKSSLQLIFILSCHDAFNELIDEELLQKLLEHAAKSMDNITEHQYDFLYAIRTLANVTLNDTVYRVFVGHFSMKVDSIKKILFMNDDVVKSLLWFLGNLFNYNSENDLFNALFS